MSYSRRQLYAMGEPLGDGATRREVGGKIIYGGGGGSKPAPKPTTTITESGPTVTDRTSVNEIPEYLTNASQDLVARGQALTARPYEAYTGARVAEFSPMMQDAFGRMSRQQVAGQIGQATGLAGLAGQQAMGVGVGAYNPYEMGGFTAERAQQYMNPYMQSVVDIERRKAQEAADQQGARLMGQQIKQGAFGGSGTALQQRALSRDTAQQLADIQTQGMGRAFDQGLARFGAEEALREQSRQYGADYGLKGQELKLAGARTGLDAAGQLGQLGQQQFGQEMDITQGIGTAGDIQRQREQALLDVGYQDYLAAQKYPYEQLAFQQGLVSGVPYSTTQRTSEISTPGQTVQQTITANPAAAAGGEVRRYAEGGITSLLSDQQIDQRQQMPGISDLARMALQAEEMERAQLRAAQQGIMAQMPQGTVADQELARIDAIEQGIGGLEVPDDLVGNEGMAGGGIVAFEEGGEIVRRARVKQRNGMALTPEEIAALQSVTEPPVAPESEGIAGMAREMSKFRPAGPQLGGITDQPPVELPEEEVEEEEKRDKVPQMSMGILDQAYNPIIDMLRKGNEQEVAAQKAYMEDLGKDEKETSEFAAKARQKIEERMAGLEGADRDALESSILDFGLRLLGSKGKENMAEAIASAGLNTLAGHKQALKEIAAKRDRYDDALAKVEEFAYDENKGTRKERRNAMLKLGQAEAGLAKELAPIFGNRASSMIQLHRDNFNAQRAASKSAGIGSKADATQLRMALSSEIQALRRKRDSGYEFTEDDAAQLAQYENEFKNLAGLLSSRVGLGGSSGKVGGSSTLPAGFKLD